MPQAQADKQRESAVRKGNAEDPWRTREGADAKAGHEDRAKVTSNGRSI